MAFWDALQIVTELLYMQCACVPWLLGRRREGQGGFMFLLA